MLCQGRMGLPVVSLKGNYDQGAVMVRGSTTTNARERRAVVKKEPTDDTSRLWTPWYLRSLCLTFGLGRPEDGSSSQSTTRDKALPIDLAKDDLAKTARSGRYCPPRLSCWVRCGLLPSVNAHTSDAFLPATVTCPFATNDP